MISRHWKGIVKAGHEEEYMRHLKTNTFPHLDGIPGFTRASILRRPAKGGTEFKIVTVWASMDAIKAFAGADPEAAVVPTLVHGWMVSYESRVTHYEIVETFEPSS